MLDIFIDEITNCLVERTTGEEVLTVWRKRDKPITFKEKRGWKFPWHQISKQFDVYELFVEGNDTVQGRISFAVCDDHVEVDHAESARHNIGHNGQYIGVGGHLFALACQASVEAGLDGFVAFFSKTGAVKQNYINRLKARAVSSQRMIIDESAAQYLINKYLHGRML